MKNFKKYFTTPASPDLVYSALTNPFTIELWTGDPAVMSTVPGSEFSLWEGTIVGKNLEFIENKLVKQQWYFDDQEVESIVTIKIHDNEDYSSIELRHINIPDEHYDNIVEGWLEVYFASMLEFLADQ